jgi:hypothetical protein
LIVTSAIVNSCCDLAFLSALVFGCIKKLSPKTGYFSMYLVMTDDIAHLTLRLLQDMRAENTARDEKLRAEISDLRAEMNARFEKSDRKLDILAEASVRQSSQIEILTMAFSRHGERLDRIESRLDRVDQRLGLDQNTH